MPYLSVLGSNFEKNIAKFETKALEYMLLPIFMQNLKSFYSVQKCLIWVFFSLELKKKTIFMYETTTLESIHLQNFAKKQECQNLRPKIL